MSRTRTFAAAAALGLLLASAPALALEWESFIVSGDGPVFIANIRKPAVYRRDLVGQEQTFEFKTAGTATPLVLQVLAPNTLEAKKDIRVELWQKGQDEGEPLLALDPSAEGAWGHVYTDTQRDLSYLRGPCQCEPTFTVPAGEYELRVSNPDNKATYALAFGDVTDATAPGEQRKPDSRLRLAVILGTIAALAGAAVYAQRKG